MANGKKEFSDADLEAAREQLRMEGESSMLVSRRDRLMAALGEQSNTGTPTSDVGVRGNTSVPASSTRGGK